MYDRVKIWSMFEAEIIRVCSTMCALTARYFHDVHNQNHLEHLSNTLEIQKYLFSSGFLCVGKWIEGEPNKTY